MRKNTVERHPGHDYFLWSVADPPESAVLREAPPRGPVHPVEEEVIPDDYELWCHNADYL